MRIVQLTLLLLISLSIQAQETLQRPNKAYQLFLKGEKFYIKGQYQEAIPYFKKAHRSYTSNADAKAITTALHSLALLHQDKKEKAYFVFYESGEKLAKEKRLSKDAMAALHFCISRYHWSYKEKKEANQLLEKTKKALEEEQASLPTALEIEYFEYLGKLEEDKGNHQEALAHFHTSTQVAEKVDLRGRNEENYAADYLKTGELNEKLSKFDEAIAVYSKILNNKDSILLGDTKKEIELNYRIGRVYFKRKQYEAALSFLKDAQKAIKTSSINAERLPHINMMIATIYLDSRRYLPAIRANTQALAYWNKEKTSKEALPHLFDAQMHQGELYQKIEAQNGGVNWYQQTVAEEEKDWSSLLKSKAIQPINPLVNTTKKVDYNLSLLHYEQAKALIGAFPKSQQQPLTIQNLMAKGALFFEANDYKRAKEHYQRALDLMQPIYAAKHPLVAEASRMLGECYLAEKFYQQALGFMDKAINATMTAGSEISDGQIPDLTQTKFPFELLNAISSKGVALHGLNAQRTEKDLIKVLDNYDAAINLLHQLRKTHRNEGAKYRLSSITHKFCQQAVVTCNTLYQLTNKTEYLRLAFRYAETSKSAILLESIRDLKARKMAGIPQEKLQEENRLKVDIAYLKSEIFYELNQGENADEQRLLQLEKEMHDKRQAHDQLLQQLETTYPTYYAMKYDYALTTLEDLQKQLDPNEAFLEYVATDSFVFVLAITQKEVFNNYHALKAPLSVLVTKFRSGVTRIKEASYINYGYQIFEAVLGNQLLDQLADKRLIIAPDAQLSYIPYGILPTQNISGQIKGDKVYEQAKFLIQIHPITYNYSAQLYLLNQTRPTTNKTAISTWAPTFGKVAAILREKGIEEEIQELPGAAVEAENIAKIFDTQSLMGAAASEHQFKQLAGNYDVLHIATHGLLNDKAPLFSSLLLSPEKEEDGLLHTYELFNMEIDAQMAVLSACNTGMGKLSKGEGVVSIARGFAYAGVPNVVMSAWSVSDETTKFIMHHFYQQLQKGQTKDIAMQQAKLTYLNNYDKATKLKAPFYWGAFMVSGNSAPIPSLQKEASSLLWLWVTLAIAVLGGLIFLLFRQRSEATTVIFLLMSSIGFNSFAQDTILTSVCINDAYNYLYIEEAAVLLEELDENNNVVAKDSFLSERVCTKELQAGVRYRLSASKEGFYANDTVFVPTQQTRSPKMRQGLYLRPKVCYEVAGEVRGLHSKQKVRTGKLLIRQRSNNQTQTVLIQDGQYSFCGECGESYQLIPIAIKHFTDTLIIALDADNCQTRATLKKKVDIPLASTYRDTFYTGDSINIHSFTFEAKTEQLTTKGALELQKIITILERNPTLIVSIGLHTDPRRSHRFNRLLSEKRAELVAKKMKEAGIAQERFEVVGKGENESIFEQTERNKRACIWIRQGNDQ